VDAPERTFVTCSRISAAEKTVLSCSGVNPAERIALTCSAMGRAEQRPGGPDDHEQNNYDDDNAVQPVVIWGLSSESFGLAPLSCAFIVLNLFCLCFVRLLFLLVYHCFGAISLT
jgi:hypothetical protein